MTITKGEINTLSLNQTNYLNNSLTQNINLEWLHEKDQSAHYNQNTSGFLYHQYETEKNIYNLGIRLDHNKIFKDHITYKIASGRKFSQSLLKLSYSTGFRSPSINQLYTPQYGNSNLRPETSKSLELSLENNWSKEVKSTSTLFYTKLFDRLGFEPNTFINRNFGEAEISGLEENIKVSWNPAVKQSLALTIMKTRDLALKKALPRRPGFNLKNIFSYELSDKYFINYELFFTGKRDDVDNNGLTVKMPSYLLSNLHFRYVKKNNNEFFLKITNVFNRAYEEVSGFGTGGRMFNVGTRFNF
jgi:vitamin B12 transporter